MKEVAKQMINSLYGIPKGYVDTDAASVRYYNEWVWRNVPLNATYGFTIAAEDKDKVKLEPILSDKCVEAKKELEYAKRCWQDDYKTLGINDTINRIIKEQTVMDKYCSPVTIVTRVRELGDRLKKLADKHGIVIEHEYDTIKGLVRITANKRDIRFGSDELDWICKTYRIDKDEFTNYVRFEQMSAKLVDTIEKDFGVKDNRANIQHRCNLAKIKISQCVNCWGITIDVGYNYSLDMAVIEVHAPLAKGVLKYDNRQFVIHKTALFDDREFERAWKNIVEKIKAYYCLVDNKEETEMPIKYPKIDINKLFPAPIAHAPNAKKVIFNGPATIVMWEDGTKTVVKAQYGETVDYEKGLAMAIVKKVMGNKGNYYTKFSKLLNKAEVVS